MLELADGRTIERFSRVQVIDERNVGRVWSFRDITVRRRAEEAAQRAAEERRQLLDSERAARAEAERTNAMKDAFLANLSHELQDAAQRDRRLVAGAPARAATRRRRAAARARGDRAQRPHPGAADRGPARHEPDHVGQGAARHPAGRPGRVHRGGDRDGAAGGGSEGHPASTGCSIPAAGPVAGDPNRLQQVVWNLLSNAIKFTPGGGRVQILLERVGAHVEIGVADTGIGISADFLAHVFERFRQQDTAPTRAHGGLGLGLAIVEAARRAPRRDGRGAQPGRGPRGDVHRQPAADRRSRRRRRGWIR